MGNILRAASKPERAPGVWRGAVMCSLLIVLTACGGGNATPTLNPTQMAAQAATLIAGLPTAESLTPQPSRTPDPTLTPAVTSVPIAPSATPEPMPSPAPTVDYTVKAGDTLLSVAYDHNTSMAAIMLLNDMGESQVVKLGQVLRLPSTPMWPDENLMWVLYIVKVGDTVLDISNKFSVKVEDVVRVNQLPNASAIRIGQTLVIPTKSPVPQPAPVEPTPTNKPVSEAPTAAPVVVEAASRSTEPEAGNSALPDMSEARAQLLALYNQARSAAGAQPLTENPVLTLAAQAHADDSAQRGYGSHVGSDGSTTLERVQRAGYAGHISGENWAWGHSAEQVFDMWFTQEAPSGPHRNNILSTRYTEVGFGIFAASGGYYFIADFGAP